MKRVHRVVCAIVVFAMRVALTAQPAADTCPVTQLPPQVCPPGSAPCIYTTPATDLKTSSDFQVTFSGIIFMAEASDPNRPSLARQAMVIQGNLLSMRHEPLLGIYGADPRSLEKASGHSVWCDQTYCWTRIHGIRIRIVGDDESAPVGKTVAEDASFRDLVPSITPLFAKPRQVKFQLCGTSDRLPKEPVDGCFDLEGGQLIAYPFKSFQQGKFVFDKTHECAPRQFADIVVWHGTTNGIARVQIKSAAADSSWRIVKMKTDHIPLLVAVANVGSEHRSSKHFALNEKLYGRPAAHLPTIELSPYPCDFDKVYCYASVTQLIDVVGCGNTKP